MTVPSGSSDANGSAGSARTEDDPLGYDVYANTLWQRVERALFRDITTGTLGSDPLVVGIFGEWGAGKSYLLDRMLKLAAKKQKEFAERRADDGGFDVLIPLTFHPWKYEHEHYLHVPLLLNVLAALDVGLKDARTTWERVAEASQRPGDAVVKGLPRLVSLFKTAVTATHGALDPASAAAVAASGALATTTATSAADRNKNQKPKPAGTFRGTDDGRYFHELHSVLAAVTRPGRYPNLHGRKLLNENFRVHFVVFIDDLDRCLPENAVSVLEIIKTIFNVESFAFVLALDDEVIERGIGHRYRDYALKNRKPEMPITGFEYLEKIVHLPFRLPALTREDALHFLAQREKRLISHSGRSHSSSYQPVTWFSGFPIVGGHVVKLVAQDGAKSSSADGPKVAALANLGHLVVNAFDSYVPRKLDRIVELFHQVAHIAHVRGRPLMQAFGGNVDPRLVLAFVMLQLFQPDLFRTLRRTGTGFDILRDSFASGALTANSSDLDLMAWVCAGSHAQNETDAGDDPPVTMEEVVQRVAKLRIDQRSTAQRVRLPIVERLIEHRAAQRHVFDPLRVFATLQQSSTEAATPSVTSRHYFGLLVLELSADERSALPFLQINTTSAPTNEKPLASPLESIGMSDIVRDTARLSSTVSDTRIVSIDVTTALIALIQMEEREQAEVANRLGLQGGDLVAEASARELLVAIRKWLDEQNTTGLSGDGTARQRLLRGLQYLARHLPTAVHSDFWGVVADAIVLPTGAGESVSDAGLAATYLDVRSALGQERRFAADAPWKWTQRYENNTSREEPIPGFVRVPAGTFTMGHKEESDNKPTSQTIEHDFYIARSHITVAQYARFVESGAYQTADASLWGAQGVEWLGGGANSKVEDIPGLAEHLKQRGKERRVEPWDWAAQQRYGNRPVTGVCWFEARAYAAWLTTQLRAELAMLPRSGYEVRLPTEPQWERAARAAADGTAHDHRWPWGDEGNDAAQRANLNQPIGHVTVPGVYAPTPLGLYDMAGNAWQWMDNLYKPGKAEKFTRVGRDQSLETAAKWQDSDCPALRGGSWIYTPEGAACSSRGTDRPDYWDNYIGFRVVLSLAKSEA